MSFLHTHEQDFINAGVSVLVLVAAWVLFLLARYGINRFSHRHSLPETDPGAETRLRMIQRLLTVAVFFVAVGLVFWIMDVSALKRVAVGMFASAGVVGIALGFAAQATMSNLVAGVIIAFAQPIRLGDNVKLDGEYGAVESIGLFYTHIRTWDNRRLIIPNKRLSDQTVVNYTLVDARMPALVVMRLDYTVEVEPVRALLLAEARRHRLLLPDPAPSTDVLDVDETGVSVRLMAWAATQADAWTMAEDIRQSVMKKLSTEGAPVGVKWSRVMTEPTP